MDPNAYLQQAQSAGENLASTIQNFPEVLQKLETNLNSIYNKDNPLIQERTGLLSDYLSAADKARASYLPQNSQGVVYSPTELQAMVSSRQGAALAPLASLNQMIVGQYGNLNDILGKASNVYQAGISGAESRLSNLWQVYQAAQQQKQFEEQQRQAQREFEASQQKSAIPDTSVIEVGGRKLLINAQTGAIITDYGSGSTSTGTGKTTTGSGNWSIIA